MIGNKNSYKLVADPLHDDFYQQLGTFMIQASCLMTVAAQGAHRVAFRFLSTTLPRRRSCWPASTPSTRRLLDGVTRMIYTQVVARHSCRLDGVGGEHAAR